MARSKRKSVKKAGDVGPSAKRAKASPELIQNNTVFGKLVQEAGLRLQEGHKQDELEVDQSLFQINLLSTLKGHPEYPQIIDEFIESLQERLEAPERFRLSLLPTVTSQDCKGSRGSTQDSLMRLLLGVTELQPKVANVLLEKLPEFDDESHMAVGNGDFDIPRLIMNQFRWLDCIVQGKELFQKMLEIVSISSVDIQRDIIICIPEVVDDSEHVLVAGELRKLLLQNTKLTVPILDALANLDLRPELLGDVRVSALRMLPRAEIDDLPVVIKFILQSVSDSDSFEVMNELRSNLDFTSIISPVASSTPANLRQTNLSMSRLATKDGEVLTLEAIGSGLRFRKNVAEGWIKAIESVSSPVEHKVIDLFVLMILHSIDNRRKAVVSLIRSKIKAGHFTEEILSAAFKSHPQIMREYFTGLLNLAGVLLRSLDPSVFAYGCAIYKLSFVSFDLYNQQEVVGALVTHIGSGYVSEVEASLEVLSEIVETHPDKMARFAIFVKDILYYLDNLKMGQIRKLFRMLSTLAFHAAEEEGIQDDMHIVIRKQLSSNSAKYKRIGIIGAIMFVQSMARHRGEQSTTFSSSSQQQSTLPDEVYKQIVNLLEIVRTCVSHSHEAAALFYDELGRIIEQGQVDPKVQTWISETVASDFQDDFLVDREATLPSTSFPMVFLFGLDEVEEGSIAVNALPLLLAGNSRAKAQKESASDRPASLTCLAPHFRLLRICEEIEHKGDLEGIDALLGCPLIGFKQEMLENLDSLPQGDREVICASLCYSINWFREVVNAFSSQGEPEMKGKTISRLESITLLQKLLEKCLAATPSFVPPLANFDFEDSFAPSSVAVGTGPRTKKGRKAKKGTDEHDDSAEKIKDAEKEIENEDEPTGKDKPKETEKVKAVSLSHYRACFRELDLSTFKMLKCGLVSRAVLDSNMNTKETTIIQLQAPQLQFLLEDLSKKLGYSLSASASSRRSLLKVKRDRHVGFSNLSRQSPKQVATFIVKDVLLVMCEHLEATSAFFQALIAKNDGVVDGPGQETEEAQLMTSCFFLLFDCLQTLFSWNGFARSENKELWEKALFVLWSRMQLSSKSKPGYQAILKQAFHYLEQFSSTVPTMGSAVVLTKLLVVINEKDNNSSMNVALSELAANFLKREWITAGGDRESGPKFNEALQYLLRIHLSLSDDFLAAAEGIAAGAMTELLEEDSSASNSYPTLTRSSMASYYKAMLEELISHVKQTQLPLKRTDSLEVKRDRLVKLNITVRIFHILINLVKAFDQRQIVGASLKYGRLFMETFLKMGMPILDELLRTQQDDVYGLIKNLQQSTRSLHHFCGHSKVEKNVTLTNHVPALKKCLETFVFRVKAMLALNKCHEAFWMGNLKNRDIQGQEIFSQKSVADEDADEEEMEVEQVDDEDEDEEPEGSVASHDTGGGEEYEDD